MKVTYTLACNSVIDGIGVSLKLRAAVAAEAVVLNERNDPFRDLLDHPALFADLAVTISA